jgi:hypothetical protein
MILAVRETQAKRKFLLLVKTENAAVAKRIGYSKREISEVPIKYQLSRQIRI